MALSYELGIMKGWPRPLSSGVITSAFFLAVQLSFAQTSASHETPVAEEQDYTFAYGLYKDGVYQLAAEQFEKFLTKFPSSLKRLDAVFLRWECSYQMDRFDESVRGFGRFVKDFPNTPLTDDAYLRIGEANLKLKKPTEAITAFKVVLDKFGDSDLAGEAAYWIAEAYSKDEDHSNAIKYYSLAYENYPKNRLRDYALYALGWVYQRTSEYLKGIEWYRRLITEFPHSKLAPSAKVRLGECYYYAKDYRRAIEELSKLRTTLEQTEERGEADYLIAEAHYQLGEYFVAQNKYEFFLSHYREHTLLREVVYALGWTFLKQKEYLKAARSFDQLTRGNDALAHAGLYRRGFVEKLSGNFEAAQKTFAEVVKRSPRGEFSDNALYESGVLLYEDHRTSDARQYFERVVSEYPSSDVLPDAQRMHGECFVGESNYTEAIRWFTEAAAQTNVSFETKLASVYQIGWCQFKLKMFKDAATSFHSVIESYPKHPKSAQAQFWLAESEYQQGNYEVALKTYQAVASDPAADKRDEAFYGIGWSYFKIAQYEKAAETFEKLVSAYPKSNLAFDARLRLGDSYFYQKDYKKAAASYRNVIRTFPANESVDYAYYQLGQSLFRQGDNTEAYQQFSSLIKVFPKSALADDAQYALGWINFQKKEYLEAVKEFQTLVGAFPKSELIPRAYYSIGDSYYNLQQYSPAEKSYREVIQQFPNSNYVVDAIIGIQYCLVAQGKGDQALAIIDEFAKENAGSNVAEELHLKKAELLFTQKNYRLAMREYKGFTEQYPRSQSLASATYWLGKCLEAQDDFSGGALTFERAANVPGAPKQIAAQSLLEAANIYSRQKKYDRAFEVLNRIEKDFNDSEVSPEAMYLKGVLFSENGNSLEARRQFEALVGKFLSGIASDKARVALARLDLAAGDPGSAQSLAEKVASSRNDEYGAEAQYLVGAALLEKEDWQNAVTAFLRVKYLFASYEKWTAKSLLGSGAAFEALGDSPKAKEAYLSVLKFKREADSVNEAQRRLKKMERL